MTRIENWNEIHGKPQPDEKLAAFLDSATDQYVILQLRHSDETVMERFASLRLLNTMGREPDIDHYELVYTASLPVYQDVNALLEDIYVKYNIDRPDDFTGHSLSVSDIVVLREQSAVSCHYVDSIGFRELPNFLKPENYLKSAEIAIEDDYGMINNGKREEPERKTSVLDRLKETKAAPSPAPSLPRKCPEEREI